MTFPTFNRSAGTCMILLKKCLVCVYVYILKCKCLNKNLSVFLAYDWRHHLYHEFPCHWAHQDPRQTEAGHLCHVRLWPLLHGPQHLRQEQSRSFCVLL